MPRQRLSIPTAPVPGAAHLALVAIILGLSGCESLLGRFMVRPPNHGRSLARVDRDEPLDLPDTVIDHRLRVEIDDPPASLSVWVIDPSNETIAHGDDPESFAWIFVTPPERTTRPPRGTVLLLHGYYDNINQKRYLLWARTLAAHGYRAVLIDQRGHGRSTGDWSTFGVVESRDMRTALDALDQAGLLVEPIGAVGVSFGAATAMRLADIDDRVRALIMISTFTSMRDVVPDYGTAIGFGVFSPAKFQRIVDHAGQHAGFDPDEADSLSRIARDDTPTLIIHGEEDRLIPIQHALRLYHAAGRDTVELIRVAEADHTSLGDTVVKPIRIPVLNWFDRHLSPRPRKFSSE